jgi:hypothetical protein
MVQRPKGVGLRVALLPEVTMLGVDGKERLLMELLTVAAMAMWRCRVYVRGMW